MARIRFQAVLTPEAALIASLYQVKTAPSSLGTDKDVILETALGVTDFNFKTLARSKASFRLGYPDHSGLVFGFLMQGVYCPFCSSGPEAEDY